MSPEQMPWGTDIADYKSYQQLRFNALHKESKNITLLTEEGDKVTISALSQFQVRYMMYDYSELIKEKTASFQTEKLNASSGNAFQMTVEGDLNQEEQADIEKILERMDSLMQDLINGDMEGLMNRAVGIIDGTDTIAGLEAVLQFEQRVEMEQQTITQLSGDGHSLQQIPHLLNPTGNGQSNIPNELFSQLAVKISHQLTEIIEESNIEFKDIVEPMNQLFSDILARLSQETTPLELLKSQLVEQIQSNLSNLMEV
jgi:ribosomal protein S13